MRHRKRFLVLIAFVLSLVLQLSPVSEAAKPARFHWPREAIKIVRSPDGKHVAVCDPRGVYLTDSTGKRSVRLRIPRERNLASEQFDLQFAFNRSSTRLAIFTSSKYGEPGISAIEQLWYTNTVRPKSRKIAEWHDFIQGTGTAVVGRDLVGWAKDSKTIILKATVWQGVDMPSAESVRSTRTVTASFDVTKPVSTHKGKLVSNLH